MKRFIVRTVQPSLDALRHDQQVAQNAQREFNAKVVQTLNGLVDFVDSEFARQRQEFDAHLQKFQAQFDTFQAQFDTFQAQFDTFQAHLNTIQSHIENRLEQIAPKINAFELMLWTFDRRKEAMEIEQIRFNQKLEQILSVLRSSELRNETTIQSLPEPARQEDYRYLVFENQHRGTEQEIKERLKDYLPYFAESSQVLDIGCGRGEFLELLRERGIQGYGIDSNQHTVEYCRQKGLDAQQADVFAHLGALRDGGLDGIFMAHVIEHFDAQRMQQLLQTCFNKLASQKYLILETPNPGSLYALSHYFYKDVTHRNPLPAETLEFFMKCAGFQDVQIVYKNPFPKKYLLPEFDLQQISMPEILLLGKQFNENIHHLNDVLYGYPDYGIIAKKIQMF
ncbi:hypothetical protein U14_00311 [Candidatus Moduliflexus flocculans]|uniref:Methyltransferase type 11 n=1 Tax=Candidatus Moduliflexus flocculans TaxID=1499966 RepID=A0A0S6VPT7_9BACT|nr:hypothetical protein U14_00311 [Candidatus Moduliflexus flocculans]